jgi:asparagine synthase (glutamine-hydrolysing)
VYLDLIDYLPDDILVKVDRASMASGSGTRSLLDHRLVEFTWSLPIDLLRRDRQSKWPLRQVLDRYVPRSLVERPKMGFGVPIDSWLRGGLRDWAESLLDARRLAEEGMFRPDVIRAAWQAHLDGHRNLQYQLWSVLMFQAWNETQGSCGSERPIAAAIAGT